MGFKHPSTSKGLGERRGTGISRTGKIERGVDLEDWIKTSTTEALGPSTFSIVNTNSPSLMAADGMANDRSNVAPLGSDKAGSKISSSALIFTTRSASESKRIRAA